jgi:hypothetical protein
VSTYNDRFLRGDSPVFLDDIQRSVVAFEEQQLRSKYEKYLSSATTEAEMQYFFESNPALVPGLYDLHNGPVGNTVISKLRLGDEFVTDFALISRNSAICQITLVEIESPRMQLFRKSDGLFTAEFLRTLQQIRDWDQWCAQHAAHLKDTFRRIYHRAIFSHQRVVVRCILVAGRRHEVVRSAKRQERWAGVNRDPSAAVMTYDRILDSLSLNPRLMQLLKCVPQNQVADLIHGDA